MSTIPRDSGAAITGDWSPEAIDELCDAFETAYRQGEQPRIGDYLQRCGGPARAAVFAELMQVEMELGHDAQRPTTYRQYLDSFPEFADVIETIAFKYGLTTAAEPAADAGVRSAGALEDHPAASGVQRIAHFQLREKLGAGGMGEVWLAWDSRLKRMVAIKFPRSQDLSEQELHRFLREGRAAAQLNHPNIVPVYEVGRDGKIAYIVTEYIEGQNLQQWLTNSGSSPIVRRALAPGSPPVSGRALAPGSPAVSGRALAPGQTNEPAPSTVAATKKHEQVLRHTECAYYNAAEMCQQLAHALHHAHERGIVHRDLKPGNILLSADGQPHVVDFGIAKWTDDTRQLTLDGLAVGTPAFMSPEQAGGHSSRVDRRADVYALGAVLYRMLTARNPFEGETPAAVLRAVLDDTPKAPRLIDRAIPRDLETICLKALEKNPQRRYATAAAMGADLARYLAGEPIVGRRPSLLEKSARLVRKRPAAMAAIALGLLTIGAIGLAGVLARENRALQEGLVPVTLETNPPGARVVFVPLDETRQEPQGEKAVYPTTRSPVSVDLKPGDYLVVAAMDGGRFHEVIRHVPRDRGEMATINRHQHWDWKDQEVVLPPIDIPELTVTNRMALIPPERAARNREERLADEAPAFYMDPYEANYLDSPQCVRPVTNEPPPGVNHDRAITVNFDRACHFAEKMGKRLPTAAEWERAAALPRRSQCQDGQNQPKEFGPAGTPECDQVGDQARITGLYSNVAEWTTTVLPPDKPDMPHIPNFPGRSFPFSRLTAMRIVKGGDKEVIEGKPTLAAEHRDPSSSIGLVRFWIQPGVGFRCVRSVSPRFLKE